MAAILKSNMADTDAKFEVAQYLKKICIIVVNICAKFGAFITKCTIGQLSCSTISDCLRNQLNAVRLLTVFWTRICGMY